MGKNISKKYVEIVQKSVLKKYDDSDRKELGMVPTEKVSVFRQGVWNLFRLNGPRSNSEYPVIVIPSLINRNYIMDLLPGHSLMEALVQSGKDVFLLDWGTPDQSMGHIGFKDYIGKYIRRAVRQIRRITGCRKIDMLGQCIGGFMAAVYCAHPELKKDIRKLALLTTPLHFENSGLLSMMTDKGHFDVEAILSGLGAVIPAEFFHSIFPFLCIKQSLTKYKTLLEQFDIPEFARIWQALDVWANDNVPFARNAFRDLLIELYQDDSFFHGKFEINGIQVGIEDIDVPLLSIAARDDHVFSESATVAVRKAGSFRKGILDYQVMPAGHVTLIAAHPIRSETFRVFQEYFK